MANPKGNPEFGAKYRFDYGREKPLPAQVSARIDTETKLQLKEIAENKNCTVPDLVRTAIEQYLEGLQASSAT